MKNQITLVVRTVAACLALASGCGDVQKRTLDLAHDTDSLSMNVEAVVAAARELSLDSLCAGCRVVLVDSTAQVFPATRASASSHRESIAVPWERLREALQSQLSLVPAPYGSYQASGDTAAMYFYLAKDSTRADVRHVGAVVDAPALAGWVVDVVLERRNAVWRVVDTRYRQP
jgi:hypothetical protein